MDGWSWGQAGIGLLLAGLVVFAVVGRVSAQGTIRKAERDQITMVPQGDPAMDAAFRKARATLDDFLTQLDRPQPGIDGFGVKLAIRHRGLIEYFWIAGVRREGEGFAGILANTPRLVSNVREGQVIRFVRDDIADWTYQDSNRGRIVGNFTACAMLTRQPPAEAAAFRKRYGLTCD